MKLSKKQRRTLELIFDPIRSDVTWSDIEKLLSALGADLTEGRGSRVRASFGGVRAVFHRPHPQKEADRGALKSVRRFLSKAGFAPEEG